MPKKIIIQIYEIQDPWEAESMLEMGVDHLGSVILSQEDWKVPEIREVINLVGKTPSKTSLIPLFNREESLFKALDYYAPDIVHFCEALVDNNGKTCEWERLAAMQAKIKEMFPEIEIMRSIPIPEKGVEHKVPVLSIARRFEDVSDYFLTDTLLMKDSGQSKDQPVSGFVGITGKTCDWDLAAGLVEESNIPVILAGGISPENVFEGILKVKPAGVDSCTMTNAADSDGKPIRFKKDPGKVRSLVSSVIKADKTINRNSKEEN